MADRSRTNCQCQQKQAEGTKNGQPLGLDELMIVNPGPTAGEAVFLGQDGTLYELQGVGVDAEPDGIRGLLLGDDGRLYQAQGAGFDDPSQEIAVEGLGEATSQELGRYFLGEDGMLYEVEDQ